MRLTNKTVRYDVFRTFEGKCKGYTVRVYETKGNKWYYCLRKGEFAFNSCWKNELFDNKEECAEAAQRKIKELEKQKS